MVARLASSIVLLSFLLLPGWMATATSMIAPTAATMATPTPTQNSIYQLTSKWQTQSGQTVSLNILEGKPVVLAMIYTSCTDSCPFMVEKIKQVERRLGARKSDVRFALFSFDSKRDIPAKLRSYAKVRRLGLKRWILFHGDPDSVRDLAAVLGIQYKYLGNGEFSHSNTIIVLNDKGEIAFQQSMSVPGTKDLVNKVTALLKSARLRKHANLSYDFIRFERARVAIADFDLNSRVVNRKSRR